MPAFEPTPEQREIVYQCSGFGLPQAPCRFMEVLLSWEGLWQPLDQRQDPSIPLLQCYCPIRFPQRYRGSGLVQRNVMERSAASIRLGP